MYKSVCAHVFLSFDELGDGMVDCVDKCMLNFIKLPSLKKIGTLFPKVIAKFRVQVISVLLV